MALLSYTPWSIRQRAKAYLFHITIPDMQGRLSYAGSRSAANGNHGLQACRVAGSGTISRRMVRDGFPWGLDVGLRARRLLAGRRLGGWR